MLEAFLNIKTRQVIPTDKKRIFSPLVSLKSMWILWKVFLNSGLSCRLLNARLLMHCAVVIMSPDLSLKWKESNATAGPSCRQRFCTQSGPRISWVSVCGQCRKQILVWELWDPSPLHITPKLLPTLLQKMCSRSVLKNARPDPSFAKKTSNFCVFWDTFTVIPFSLWLCLSWMRVFMASTKSLGEGLGSDLDSKN